MSAGLNPQQSLIRICESEMSAVVYTNVLGNVWRKDQEQTIREQTIKHPLSETFLAVRKYIWR